MQQPESSRKDTTEAELRERDHQKELFSKHLNVLDAADQLLKYQPKTKENQDTYAEILTLVSRLLGDQPDDVIRSAADEALEVVFDERLTAPEKKREVEASFGKLSDDDFAELTGLVNKITDYQESDEGAGKDGAEDGAAAAAGGTEQGVSVVFDSDDEKNDMELESGVMTREIVSDDDDDELEGEDTAVRGQAERLEEQSRVQSGAKVEEERLSQVARVEEVETLDPNVIDGYWLQRQLRDMKTGRESDLPELTDRVLSTLNSKSVNQCANRLMELLGPEQLRKVQLFLKNRAAIYYCTLLATASEQEKEKLYREMAQSTSGSGVLQRLRGGLGVAAGSRDEKKDAKDVKASGAVAASAAASAAAAAAVGAARTLDLDELKFESGGQFMGRKDCRLPPGSYRESKKGYEEVGIPMPKPPKASDPLVRVADMPEWARAVFPYKTLTRIQSRVFPTAFYKPDNLLVCAPTGSGKTNVAMLAMLHEIGLHRADGAVDLGAFKIVYIAPMKSLVQEMVGNFGRRLAPLGVTVRELSGDVSLTKAQLAETQVIVTTPEKWDIVTRKVGDKAFAQLVKLVIIDEVHLLHDTRGPVLEAIVARYIRYVEQSKEHVRIVGLSATLPGYEDVAAFLRVKPEHIFAFDNAYRPVPLEQTFVGVTERSSVKRYNMMNELTYQKVVADAGVHQVLVFVHSRKETAKVAKELRDMAVERDTLDRFMRDASGSRAVIKAEVEHVVDADLRDVLPYGFAIHHAGLPRSDRTRVEELFADGHVAVLVSTSTLAWGVNLPAHTVIVRGTQVYSPERGCWTELGPLDMLQMVGRAGRPQYDTEGHGIVITSHDRLQYYLSLLNHQLPIESQLIAALPDVLNAEIVLGNVHTLADAADWLAYTYLYVCMLREPATYGVGADEAQRDKTLYQRRVDLAHSAATLLDRAHLIQYDRKTGAVQPTDLGAVASHYYVSYRSMLRYNEALKPTLGDIDLFRLFSLSCEFEHIPVRKEERAELERLLEKVPVPVKEAVDDPAAKINVLLQAYISRVSLAGLALSADMVYVSQSAARIARALFEVVLRRGWAQLAERTLALCKMIERRMWLSQTPLRQFASLPPEVLHHLDRQCVDMDHLYQNTSQELGALVAAPQLGYTLFRHVHAFPRCALSVGVTPVTRTCLKLDLAVAADFKFSRDVHGGAVGWWVLVEDGDGEKLLHHEYLAMKEVAATKPLYVTFTVPVAEPLPPQYFIKVVADRWLGAATTLPVSLRHLTLPEKFPPHTDLFDLKPLPLASLNVPEYIALYQGKIRELNPIQTQTFAALYEGDESVFVGAPSASGKTFCAELALLRLWRTSSSSSSSSSTTTTPPPTTTTVATTDINATTSVNTTGGTHPLAVYVQPVKSMAHERYLEWKKRFGEGLGKRVVELTGDAADRDLCASADLCVATPEQWDAVSRGWKRKRNPTRSVRLFIVDDLHLLGDDCGPTLEVVVSRMRIVSSILEQEQRAREQQTTPATDARQQQQQQQKQQQQQQQQQRQSGKIRFIGLAYPIANGHDIAEWIGATPATMFNFNPNVRFTPLEIYIQNFDNPNYSSRMTAMLRPAMQAVRRRAAGKPTIIFCPTKRHVFQMVTELVQHYDRADPAFSFLKVDAAALAKPLEVVKTRALRESAQAGVVFLHEGQDEQEREVVRALFKSGATQVLVASHEQCWSMGVQANTVIIQGTEYPSGHYHVDYPVTTLLKMVGRATRVGIDKVAKCSILCYAPKKAYYVKFLEGALPVESHLHEALADTLNAEVAAGWITSMQGAFDYTTWCFFYRRLTQNPNAYNLTATSTAKLSVYLSNLVQQHVNFLVEADCVKLEEQGADGAEVGADEETGETRIVPLNLGFIASHYYIHCTTVELFKKSLTERTKMKGLLDILSNASEFADLPVRQHEEPVLRRLAMHLPVKVSSTDFKDPHVKANVLLQCFFSRTPLASDLRADQAAVLADTRKLLRAMVDVIGSAGWLTPATAAMELAQMCVQGVWSSDTPLRQVPHLTDGVAAALAKYGVDDVFGLKEMDDDDRRHALAALTDEQVNDVAQMCNKYPDIDITFDAPAAAARPGETVGVSVALARTTEDGDQVGVPTVYAPRARTPCYEGWWLLVSDAATKTLLAVRWLALARTAKLCLEFAAPPEQGRHALTLTLMSDSYLGCDQEYSFDLDVAGAPVDDGGDVDME